MLAPAAQRAAVVLGVERALEALDCAQLVGAMGSAALQALWSDLTHGSDEKPFSIDGCHALKAWGPQVARFFTRWHRPEAEEV